ncbi:hypothetical protein D3C85_1211170 [compost metagenome]
MLQQQAAGTTAIGVQPEARIHLLRHDEIVGETIRQGFTVEIDNALVALTLGRIDGQCQYAVGHQVGEGRIGCDPVGLITGQPADLTFAGTFDHQQRHRTIGAGLKNQQSIELQGADQQRRRRHQFAEQLCDRLRIGMFGQDFGIASLQRNQLAAGVAVIEDEALGVVGIRQVGHRSGYLK